MMGSKRKLTPKQKRFVAEYLKDFNGTQAAIRAGFSPKRAAETAYDLRHKTLPVIADKLVGKTWVSEAIKKQMAERLRRIFLKMGIDPKIAKQLFKRRF